MTKLRSKQVKFKSDVPTLISDMKDGELRSTRTGLVGRKGDLAHAEEWSDTYLYMDPFDQAQLDDIWAVTYSKGSGAAAADNGRLKVTADAVGGGSRVHVKQELWNRLALPHTGLVYFDIWGKITAPLNPTGNSGDHYVQLYANGNYYQINLQFSGSDTYRVSTLKESVAQNGPYVAVGTSGANEAWWRLRYLPGDLGIRVYWQHMVSPLDIGWKENTNGGVNLPGSEVAYLEFRVQNNDTLEERIAHFELKDWVKDGAQELLASQDDTQMYVQGASWEFAKIKTVADSENVSQIKSTIGIGYSTTGNQISRPYFKFPLNFPAGTVISKAFLHYETFGNDNHCNVVLQEIDADFPLSVSDWNSHTGPILNEPFATHAKNYDDHGTNEIPFNEDGLAYLNSVVNGTAKFCLREYDHDYLDVNPLAVLYASGCEWYDNDPPRSGMQLHLYFETVPFTQLQVVGDRQLGLSGDVPATVEEMGMGELRITDEGIFGRISGIVQKKDWMKTLFYDYFDDGIIDARWDWQSNKSGGSAVEANGELAITCNADGQSYYQARQFAVVAIPQEIPAAGEFYFDLWGKMTHEADPGVTGNNSARVQMYFQGGAAVHMAGLKSQWNSGTQEFTLETIYSDGTFSDSGIVLSTIGVGLSGAEEFWWRLRFLPGDSKVRVFWRHKLHPHRHGWVEWIPPTATCSLVGQTNMIFDFLVDNDSASVPRIVYFDQVGDWVGEEVTTTTTTTTTTTIACGVTGGYYEFLSRDDYNTEIWTLDGAEGVNWEIEGDTIVNLQIETATPFSYSPGGGRGSSNKQPFVLPIVNVDINVEEISASGGSDWNNLLSIDDYVEGPGKKVMRSYIDHTTGELFIIAEGTSTIWTWNGSTWIAGSFVSTGVVWELNKWWEYTINRNELGQWRVVIEDENNIPVVTTDWKDWIEAEVEEGVSWGGNAACVVIGRKTSGPGGCPKGRYRRFSTCTGMRRFVYNSFQMGATPTAVDNWLDITSVGAGGTLNIPDSNYRLTFDMNARSGVPSELIGTMPFGNTGVMDLDEFDVWGQLHIPSGLGAADEQYVQWLLIAHNIGGDHEAGLRLRYTTGTSYELQYRAVDDSLTDDWTAVSEAGSQNEMWVRMRYLPSQGDTKIKLYYSEVDPTSVYGWEPIEFATASPNMAALIQANGAEFEMKGYSNSLSPQIFWITAIDDARRDTFQLTTTTSTTVPGLDLHFDGFEDGVINPLWDSIIQTKEPVDIVEETGALHIKVGPGTSAEGRVYQTAVDSIDWKGLGHGVWDFDMYWKVTFPAGMDSSNSNTFVQTYYTWSGVGNSDGAGFMLTYQQATDDFTIQVFSQAGGSQGTATVSTLGRASGGRHMWLRLRFKPGVDSDIRYFWAHGPENPQYVGWTEYLTPKYPPDPTGQTNLEVFFRGYTTDTIAQRDVRFEFLGDYYEASSTTTTTTTTPPGQWIDFTNDTRYQDLGLADEFLWNAGGWWYPSAGFGNIGLEAIGTWSLDFRPTKMRITHNELNFDTTIKDTNGDTIGYEANLNSLQELDLTFTTYDLNEIIIVGGGSLLEVSKIEYYIDPVAFPYFVNDEFNDAAVGEWWSTDTLRPWKVGISAGDSPGGTVIENSGFLRMPVPQRVSLGQFARALQNVDDYFDIYAECRLDESGGGGTDGTILYFTIYDTLTLWGMSFEYGYDQGTGNYNLYYLNKTTGGTTSAAQITGPLAGRFGSNTIWLRLRYRAGDAAPQMYYSEDETNWIPSTMGPNDLTLVDFSGLILEFAAKQYDGTAGAEILWDYVRDGSVLTTTTTTTTT